MVVCLVVCLQSSCQPIFHRNTFRKWISSISCSVREGVGGNHQPQLQAALSNALTLSRHHKAKQESHKPTLKRQANAQTLSHLKRTATTTTTTTAERQTDAHKLTRQGHHHRNKRSSAHNITFQNDIKKPYTSPLHYTE